VYAEAEEDGVRGPHVTVSDEVVRLYVMVYGRSGPLVCVDVRGKRVSLVVDGRLVVRESTDTESYVKLRHSTISTAPMRNEYFTVSHNGEYLLN